MGEGPQMAKFTVVKIVDDLDGSESPDAETVTFGIDGTNYEIDLSPENSAALHAALAPFVEKARPVTVTSRKSGTVTRIPSNAGTIRAWAKSQNIEVSERGRIPETLRVQFANATNANA